MPQKPRRVPLTVPIGRQAVSGAACLASFFAGEQR
jgi:hypothetical protein